MALRKIRGCIIKMDYTYVKIVVFAPLSHADAVRDALAGAGHIGNYSHCTFSSRGVGRFTGGVGSDPFIGTAGVLEEVEEERIETICPFEIWRDVVEAVTQVHPYEEPAIDIIPLLNR